MKILTSLFVMILLLFMFYILFYSIDQDFLAKYNTEYTKRFSYEKFNTIEVGMSKQQVQQILGRPFGTSSSNEAKNSYKYECVNYSQPGSHSELFFPWDYINICFDKDDRVFQKNIVVLY